MSKIPIHQPYNNFSGYQGQSYLMPSSTLQPPLPAYPSNQIHAPMPPHYSNNYYPPPSQQPTKNNARSSNNSNNYPY